MNDDTLSTTTEPGLVTLHIPARFAYLRVLRQSVLDTCARAGLSEFETAQLEMAVDEACANVIEHSYNERPGAESGEPNDGIKVNLIQQKDCIIVEIYDRGAGFDSQSATCVTPEEYIDGEHERGLGLFIINRFVDKLEYERDTPCGNCLRLIKNI